jgi:beta-glucosidase/6-phospho-beta-glucosidase/beta-galactosidase
VPLPPRSALAETTAPDAFCWATGIEDTFIVDPWPATGRTLDEYALTRHYELWEEDLARAAGLGISAIRYGIPWHRVHPAPGRFDFAFADAALDRLLELGVTPIVDLVHYGTPRWLESAFLHPDFAAHMAEYAHALATRFRGRVRWYTPLNEPRIAAWYAGRIGWWPPYLRGWRGFVRVLLAICNGIAATARALRAADPEIVLAHVDATDLYETAEPPLEAEVARRQEIVFLALDLLAGRVVPDHPLHGWLVARGASPAVLESFAAQPVPLDVVGINLYPMFTWKRLSRASGQLRARMPYARATLLERLADLYFERYRRPIFVTETAALGSVRRRRAWLDDSVEAVRRLRARGVPVIGYTWWPMFALVAWGYRQGTRSLERHLLPMGLFELDPRPEAGLARVATPLVDAYRELATTGSRAVGRLAPGRFAGAA